ncbi:8-amino-7-oxononanoate synthase [Rhizobium leguminosarum]|uniref:8-amino-7-oxononanoate synthase n=1 Tax=Rhizobium leguminosarum TaxID=384 RepID=A0AAE2MPY4_RHILE|nr:MULTISPECIES: 8-amino-7-oxononanoate synthase [Rhizobium]ARM90897.1 8-amino-7-oxononanoate synthase [Rhizobium sp. CIAT894]MBB4293823.1 8-amino-7-oxononanoate synthase [Rhizobium leguminosarum]MBB4299484.1 8-amino-7-oxononanoate synthase [Rhizobium leguminosarum]MBB4310922.1 8-amino-7-oxononanoate synthase [Rhizobium leguminosarum]MBB4419966.1 8-amino-7-oxononanoate synthase [Rhizobium leguminosarum]
MLEAAAEQRRTLEALMKKGRYRELAPKVGLDFTSNDYLGLAASPRLRGAISWAIDRGVPVGSGGSRLLRGNHPEHEALEQEAARFFGADRALYWSSGFAANAALFSTLPRREDLVIYDELVHASVHEGIASIKAQSTSVPHNDADAFSDAIRRWRLSGGKGRVWIAVESLYSMEGDQAPLTDLAEIANREGAFLIIDEAHATGIYGAGGRGFSASLEGRENVIVLHTCGKALGVSGAIVCASRTICEYLVNRARSFIYSTAPSPLAAAAVREALKIVSDSPQRRTKLQDLATFANSTAIKAGFAATSSQIIPIKIGASGHAMRVAEQIKASGFDVRAIRPPTVPEGTARLRVAITLQVDRTAVTTLFGLIREAMERQP